MNIAIDAMGGDNAPKEIVVGVYNAAKERPNIIFTLLGDEKSINNCLKDCENLSNIKIIHTNYTLFKL